MLFQLWEFCAIHHGDMNKTNAIIDGILMLCSLGAIGYGAGYFFGAGGAALSVGALVWHEVTRRGPEKGKTS